MKYKLKTKIRRWLTKKMNLNRPTTYPFISGDAFKALANHILDESFNFDPKKVFENEIIFVRNNHLEEFFELYLPKINHNFILISHNDDAYVKPEYKKYLSNNSKIKHWFCLNANFKHEKITPIPIGVYNNRNDRYFYFFKAFKYNKKILNRDNKISYNFSLLSHETRPMIEKKLRKNKNSIKIKAENQEDYYNKISNNKYIASPQGRGVDCHRTWESLYLNIIPIVDETKLSLCFKEEHKISLITIKDWSKISEDEIINQYSFDKINNNPIYMDYWINLIRKK